MTDDLRGLEWAAELLKKAGLWGESGRAIIAALAEPLRRAEQRDNEIAELARRVLERDAEEIPRLEKRIEELEAALRSAIRRCRICNTTYLRAPACSACAADKTALLDTEAKP